MAYSMRGSARLEQRPRTREALDFRQRALALAREFGDHATEAHALSVIGSALVGAGDVAGYESLEKRSRRGARSTSWKSMPPGRTATGSSLRSDPRFRARRTVLREGVTYCEEHGIFSHSSYIRAYCQRLASSIAAIGLKLARWRGAAAEREHYSR